MAENSAGIVEALQNDFLNFCKQHKIIYLYGAGRFGQMYAIALQQMGIEWQGFLVSAGESSEISGRSIVQASSVRGQLSKDVGIIAAFKGANEVVVRQNVGEGPDIFFPGAELHRLLMYDLMVFPFLEKNGYRGQSLKPLYEWNNILIIRLDVLGDLIMTTPFIRELRRNCPKSHITMIVRPSNRLLFQDCPYISELLLYDCESDGTFPSREEEFQCIARQAEIFARTNLIRNYDVVIQPCSLTDGRGGWDAAFLAFASKADCQVGRLYAQENDKLLSEYLYTRFQQFMSFISLDAWPKHEVACILDMLRQCGGKVRDERLELWVHDREEQLTSLQTPVPFEEETLWIAVGLVGRLPAQNWPPERYREVFQKIDGIYPGVGFVLLGGAEARQSASIVLADSKRLHIVDLTGQTTLTQAIAVMDRCTFYLGANTGLMHLAAARGKPVIEISSYLRNEAGRVNSPMGPWGVPSIAEQAMPGLDGCSGSCAKSYPHCIKQITVDDVYSATMRLLRNCKVLS